MNEVDSGQVEQLIDEIVLLQDLAKAKLEDVKKAIKDPQFLKSAIKSKERALSKKIDDLLRATLELNQLKKN